MASSQVEAYVFREGNGRYSIRVGLLPSVQTACFHRTL